MSTTIQFPWPHTSTSDEAFDLFLDSFGDGDLTKNIAPLVFEYRITTTENEPIPQVNAFGMLFYMSYRVTHLQPRRVKEWLSTKQITYPSKEEMKYYMKDWCTGGYGINGTELEDLKAFLMQKYE